MKKYHFVWVNFKYFLLKVQNLDKNGYVGFLLMFIKGNKDNKLTFCFLREKNLRPKISLRWAKIRKLIHDNIYPMNKIPVW